MNIAASKPDLDLLRLRYDHTGYVIDTHVSEKLVVFSEDWTMTMTPISGQSLRKVESALQRIVRRGGPTFRSDSISIPTSDATVHRYLRGIENGHFVAQGNYLVEIDDYWLNASVFARNPGELFDQNAIDQFFMSLELLDQPVPDVPPAWKAYQQDREANTPNGKFVLYMDPAPILLGNYSGYLGLVKSGSFPSFKNSDSAHGGRMIGEELIEFYSKDDPTSVRVDVWIDREPASDSGSESEKVYSGMLTAMSSKIQLWSLSEPYSFTIDPGVYDVEILLVNRGKYENGPLPDRQTIRTR
ncbi:MAG: hypothetical protein U0930_17565 [Pirellulales bacterium]